MIQTGRKIKSGKSLFKERRAMGGNRTDVETATELVYLGNLTQKYIHIHLRNIMVFRLLPQVKPKHKPYLSSAQTQKFLESKHCSLFSFSLSMKNK